MGYGIILTHIHRRPTTACFCREQTVSNHQLSKHGIHGIVLLEQHLQVINPFIREAHHPGQMGIVLILFGIDHMGIALQILLQSFHILWVRQGIFGSNEQRGGDLKICEVVEGHFCRPIMLDVTGFAIVKAAKMPVLVVDQSWT